MARFGTAIESQATQIAGLPSTVTYNGYFAALVAGSANGFTLRRVQIGVRYTSTPISQQQTIALYRQTVRAVDATNLANVAGVNLGLSTTTDPTAGIDYTTGTTAATNGPTLGARPIAKYTFNTQSFLDVPYELLEMVDVVLGTANGIAFVNIGNTLPTGHLFVLSAEWEV